MMDLTCKYVSSPEFDVVIIIPLDVYVQNKMIFGNIVLLATSILTLGCSCNEKKTNTQNNK